MQWFSPSTCRPACLRAPSLLFMPLPTRAMYVSCPQCAGPDDDPSELVYPCPSCGGQGVLLDVVQFLTPAQRRVLRRWKGLMKRLFWRARARVLWSQNGRHWKYMAGLPEVAMDVWLRRYHEYQGQLSGSWHANALGLWGWLVWRRVVRIRGQQTRFAYLGLALRSLKELAAR